MADKVTIKAKRDIGSVQMGDQAPDGGRFTLLAGHTIAVTKDLADKLAHDNLAEIVGDAPAEKSVEKTETPVETPAKDGEDEPADV